MHARLLLHPNFHALKHRLKLPTYAAVGLLDMLWQIAAHHAEDGNLTQFTPDALAAALDWQGTAAELITALVETHWLDETAEGRLSVHDWPTFAPARIRTKLVKQAAQMVTACESTCSESTEPEIRSLNNQPSPAN